VVRPGPKQPCAVFIKTVHAVRIIPFSNRIDREQWFAAPRAGVGVETAHATAIGGDPVNTAASFQQMVNYRRRQSALHAVSDEAMAVETAQPAPGAEPEEAARVPYNELDGSARQAVSRRIGFDRKLLRPPFSRNSHE